MPEPGLSMVQGGQGAMELTGTAPFAEGTPAVLRAVGSTIRRLRERRGDKQSQVAARAGISESVLSRVERAQRIPSLSTLLCIANALEVRFSDLVRVAEDEAFPLGHTPWAPFSAVVLGPCAAEDAGVTVDAVEGEA